MVVVVAGLEGVTSLQSARSMQDISNKPVGDHGGEWVVWRDHFEWRDIGYARWAERWNE